MKTYHILYTEINRYPVEIEAESREDAQGKLYDNFNDYIDTLCPDDTEISLEISEPDESASESCFTQDELLRLSNCVLAAIANNNRASAYVFDPAIIKQIEKGNQALRDLNSKICALMKGDE